MKSLLIDIDGLRPDVFSDSLSSGLIPNISRLLGGKDMSKGIQIPILAPAPSITFTSQASLFTGMHPSQHGIPGNQFFDRFGTHNDGTPRYYAFDVGDTLAVDDAVLVFTQGLASKCLAVPTIYERFSDWGWKSVVAGNMFAEGADTWLKPSLVNIARFTKGGNLFGMSSQDYDGHIVDLVISYIDQHGLPDLLTVYFMGLDHESHKHGPEVQMDFLSNVIDPLIGELWNAVVSLDPNPSPLISIFSDHGQIRVKPDDRHSLRLAFPLEREMGHLFDALSLDVHDFPGEDPECDAVVASNGGLAHVYLQNQHARWGDTPEFERDVLLVAKAFWDAHNSGKHATEIKGALSAILIRDVEKYGWFAPYNALSPDSRILTLEEWFSGKNQANGQITNLNSIDPVHRLNNLVSPYVGDLLLISNYQDGFYFSAPTTGVHGGLHPEDSSATLVFGLPGAGKMEAERMRVAVLGSINARCQAEGGRQPSTSDFLTGFLAALE